MTAPRSITAVLAGVALAAAGCGGDSSDGDEVHIAGMFTLSGETADVQSARGARLAVAEINRAGGVMIDGDRRRLRLRLTDDRAEPQVAVARANELLSRPGVAALVGPSKSVVAVPVGAVAERAGIPMITPASTSPATTRDRRFVFRTTFTDDVQGAVAAQFARQRLRARTAAVMYEATSPYNSGLATSFRQEFLARGGKIVGVAAYTVDEEDHARGMDRLAAARPDVLYLPNAAPDVELQARRARRVGLAGTLLGGDAWDVSRLRDLPLFDGSYATTLWSADTRDASARAFVQTFQRAYGTLPSAYAASSYDAVRLIAGALRRAGSVTPSAIRDELDAVTVHDGAVGRLVFGDGGDPETGAVVLRLGDGRAKASWRLPAASPGS